MPNFKFTIEGDTAAAEKALRKLATEADNVDESISDIDLTQVGRSMLDFAARAGKAMLSLVKSSSALAESQNFVKQVFKDGADEIGKWAETADRTALLSERAALQGAASLGIFGQRIQLTGKDLANFSIGLTELAADMASVANTDVEQAVTAIAAAMRNEYEPIRRYGAVLNDVVLKKRIFQITGEKVSGQLSQEQKILAVNAELFDQLGFAIGDVEATFGEFANQSRYAEAQAENLKAELGDALRPAFINLLEAGNGVLGMLSSLPAPIKEVGATAAVTAVGFIALGGAILFVVGQGQKAVAGFKAISLGIDKMAASNNAAIASLGKAGPWAAAAAAGVVAGNIMLGVLNDVRGVAEDTAEALTNFQVSANKGPSVDTYKEFLNVLDEVNRNVSGKDIFTTWGRSISLAGANATVSIEVLEEAINKLSESSKPENMVALRDTLEAQLSVLEPTSKAYEDTATAIELLEEKIRPTVLQLQLQGQALDPSIAKEFGDEQANLAKIEEDLAKAIADTAEKIGDINLDFAAGEQRAKALGEALDTAFGPKQFIQNMAAYAAASQELFDGFKDDEGVLDQSKIKLDAWTESGRDNISALEGMADTMNDEVMRVYRESHGDMDKTTAKAAELRDMFVYQAIAAGLTQEQISEYLTILGLTPEEVETQIKLSGQTEAKAKLDALGLDLAQLPESKQIEFAAAIDRGDFITAWDVANAAIVEQGDLTVGLLADPKPLGPVLTDMQRQADDSMIETALKAYPTSPQAAAHEMQEQTPDLNTDVVSHPTDVTPTTANMQGHVNNLNTRIDANPTDPSPATSEMQGSINRNNPLAVPTKAQAGDVGAAHADMQRRLDNNPLYATVKASVDRAWAATLGKMGLNATSTAAPPSSGGTTPMPSAHTAPTLMAVPAPVVAGRAAPQTTHSVVNFNVQLPTGADETRVVASLRKYSKNMGALPIQIAS